MLIARYATPLVAFVAVTVGCASHAGRDPGSAEATSGTSASTVVTAQELARIGGQSSLMDALARVRPFMLASRGTAAPRVSVDGAPPGELALLQTIPTSLVREVRLDRSSSSVGQPAIESNGDVTVGNVIVVTTWQGKSHGASATLPLPALWE